MLHNENCVCKINCTVLIGIAVVNISGSTAAKGIVYHIAVLICS